MSWWLLSGPTANSAAQAAACAGEEVWPQECRNHCTRQALVTWATCQCLCSCLTCLWLQGLMSSSGAHTGSRSRHCRVLQTRSIPYRLMHHSHWQGRHAQQQAANQAAGKHQQRGPMARSHRPKGCRAVLAPLLMHQVGCVWVTICTMQQLQRLGPTHGGRISVTATSSTCVLASLARGLG